MGHVAHVLRRFVDALLGVLDPLPAAVSLAIVAAVTALAMLAIVRRASPQRLIARSRARIAAAIYEMRLYIDRPRRVLAAQGRLAAWTVVYLVSLVPAALVLALPLGILYLELDVRHGLAPFDPPTDVVVRVAVAHPPDARDVVIEPIGKVAVTAIVRAPDEGAVYARISIREPGTHHVVARLGRAAVTKEIVASPAARVVAPERRGGLARLWASGSESPPSTGSIVAISVQHPERTTTLPVPWWAYWLGLATILALALRRRFDVAL